MCLFLISRPTSIHGDHALGNQVRVTIDLCLPGTKSTSKALNVDFTTLSNPVGKRR